MENLKRGGVCDIIKPKAPERIKQGEKDCVPGKSGRSEGKIFPARQSGVGGSFPREARFGCDPQGMKEMKPVSTAEKACFSFCQNAGRSVGSGVLPKSEGFLKQVEANASRYSAAPEESDKKQGANLFIFARPIEHA
ncbi:MAG: hypothetical protein IJL39_02120 [Clostridia bacterium]|nr:hypothetical protein [Clostridia bacterium]